MTRRSILFVSLMNGAAWGGSEELWSKAAARAASRGARVACAVFRWPEKAARLEALRGAGCEIFELPNGGRARGNPIEKLEYETWTRLQRRRALGRLPAEQFDHVVVNQGGCQEVAARELAPFTGRLRWFALTYHSLADGLVLSRARAARLRDLVQRASANLFASARIAPVLEGLLGISIPRARVFVNPIGFEVETPPPPLPPAPPYRLATLSALQLRVKAQDRLVEALARPEWRDRPVELEIWGDGPDAAALRALVERLGLSSRVRLMGHADDPRAALVRAHLLVQASRVEAVGISVMEAMALGRPVLVSRVGDMPLWVEHGVGGIVCESADDVAVGLEEAWARRADWARMGAAAHLAYRARCPRSAVDEFLDSLEAA